MTRAGIGLTGVGSATIGATAAGAALVGKPLNGETIEEAAVLAAEASRPRSDHRGSATFKRHIVHTFVTRLLNGVYERRKGRPDMTSLYEERRVPR